MNPLNRTLLSVATTVAFFLVGCENGSGPVAGIDRGGVQGGGAVGPVSGFGSVIVNGTHYDTVGATISVNGAPATEADLEIGHVVVIHADFSDAGAQARSIEFNHNVIGPLTAVDVAAGQITVMEQTVRGE